MNKQWMSLPFVVVVGAIAVACGGSTGETSDGGADATPEAAPKDAAPTDAGPTCAAPAMMCGATCTNVETDNANCGTCGNKCDSGKVCSGGQCSLTCGSLTTCGQDGGAPYCANTKTDNANCGACGNACPSGKVCDNGQCSLTCGSLTTCSPDGGAPYCASTDTDNANCGACGNVCPTGQACSGGKCQLPPGSQAAGCAGTTDPNWSNVIAYVSCNGNKLADASGKSTLAAYNSPTISATPAGAPGGSSCSMGNGGSYGTANGFGITLPAALGTGDFTVEFAVYQTAWNDPSDQNSNILLTSTAYPPGAGGFPTFFSHGSTAAAAFVPGTGGAAPFVDTGSTLDTWELYAVSRVSGTTYLFRDGVLLTSFADTSDYSDTVVYSGVQQNGAYNALMGSIGQIRVTTAGRYTASYTPCSGAFATQ